MSAAKILIVEAERSIRELLQTRLEANGFSDVSFASDGASGLSAARTTLPDLIVLDLSLPDVDGLRVCRDLNADPSLSVVPTILLSSENDDANVAVGLELGANDYVVKPIDADALVSRIRVQFRRRKEEEKRRSTLRSGPLSLDVAERTTFVDGRELDLTFSEFEILRLMLGRPGRAYSRREIVVAIKGEDADVAERAVDVQIVNLRRKLGEHAPRIETVRGVGYRLKRS